MVNIFDRAKQLTSVDMYKHADPEPFILKNYYDLEFPSLSQYVLRMLVKTPMSEIQIPRQLRWVQNYVQYCQDAHDEMFPKHCFTYLTVRHGTPIMGTDDQWHVDGFSMKFPHLPEQNFFWCDHTPPEFALSNFSIPSSFDPLKDNIHSFFGKELQKDVPIYQPPAGAISIFDPYLVHRKIKQPRRRSMIRITFVPILIEDDDNSVNSLIPVQKFNRSGKEYRENLRTDWF